VFQRRGDPDPLVGQILKHSTTAGYHPVSGRARGWPEAARARLGWAGV